jgi:hypothetical protein
MREMQAHHPTPEVERRLKADERSGRSGLSGERRYREEEEERERTGVSGDGA